MTGKFNQRHTKINLAATLIFRNFVGRKIRCLQYNKQTRQPVIRKYLCYANHIHIFCRLSLY